jgi:streptogramin lyase
VLDPLRTCAVAVGLVAGCSCGEPVLVPDTGSDAPPSADAFLLDAGEPDAPRDVGMDAWEPDAWIPDRLILREYDMTPCPPVVPQPHRARALPADSTPRVLWTRSYLDLGIEGVTYNAGSVDRQGNLTFDARLVTSSVFEVDPAGALRGAGQHFTVEKGLYGPTVSLVDGRSVEFFLYGLRLDSAPPIADDTILVDFRSLSPIGVDFAELAATSDGGFYAQRASHSALRKYCGDGRLQWELLGIHRADGMLVEADDSVWLPGTSAATDYQVARVDPLGHEIERVPYPEGTAPTGMTQRVVGDVSIINAFSSDERTLVIVARRESAELWRVPLDVEDFFVVTPAGHIWINDRSSGDLTLYESGLPTIVAAPVALSIAGEDGSFLGIYGPGVSGIQRLRPDGTIAWTLPISEPFDHMTLDVDGRLYLYGSGHVIAVQTDVLPPSVRGCWQHRCSPRGDNRIEPLP